MKITIDAFYSVGSSTDVDIPVDSWDQIKDCYVKWDVFHYTLDNVEWKEVSLGDLSLSNIDFTHFLLDFVSGSEISEKFISLSLIS